MNICFHGEIIKKICRHFLVKKKVPYLERVLHDMK